MTDLVAGRGSSTLPERTSYRPGLVAGDLADVLPAQIVQALRDGFPKLDQKLPGYLMEEAILVGVETTTSTPVRMERDEGREKPGYARPLSNGRGGWIQWGHRVECHRGHRFRSRCNGQVSRGRTAELDEPFSKGFGERSFVAASIG